jgi:hypothetical protein
MKQASINIVFIIRFFYVKKNTSNLPIFPAIIDLKAISAKTRDFLGASELRVAI